MPELCHNLDEVLERIKSVLIEILDVLLVPLPLLKRFLQAYPFGAQRFRHPDFERFPILLVPPGSSIAS